MLETSVPAEHLRLVALFLQDHLIVYLGMSNNAVMLEDQVQGFSKEGCPTAPQALERCGVCVWWNLFGMIEMEENYGYLMEGSEGLFESCDILLILDDGSDLPVHSQVLARCSPLFHGMLNEGTLSSASAAKKIILPFSGCSREEATDFLSVIYSLRPHKYIDVTSALSIARLGDNYGVKV